MPVRTETRTIAGHEVTTTQLPAMRALALADDAIRFGALRGEELLNAARKLLALTSVISGGQLYSLSSDEAINAVFSGDLAALLLVVGFVIEVNYASFSDGPAGGDASAGAGPTTSPSTSTTTSPQPGPSGG